MRLILQLKSLKEIDRKQFEKDWRPAFSSFLYNLLSKSQIEFVKNLHDEIISPFCFSNIRGTFGENGKILIQPDYLLKLSYKEEKEWIKKNRYQIIISIANKDVAMALVLGLADVFRNETKIELKEAQFILDEVTQQGISLKSNDIIYTDNVVILKENTKDKAPKFILYQDSEKNPDKNGNCIVDKELFIKTLQNDLVRKAHLSLVTNEQIKGLLDCIDFDFDYCHKSKINNNKIKEIKQTIPAFKLKEKDSDKYYYVTGNKIAIRIKENTSQDKLNILNKIFDSGLGSHTSYGLGFLMKK